MALSKEEALAKLFENIILKQSKEKSSTSDPLKTNDKVDNKVVDGETEEKFGLHNESAKANDSSNTKFDDNTFVSSLFEEGESSTESEGTTLLVKLYTLLFSKNCFFFCCTYQMSSTQLLLLTG